jgi:DNA-binding winged helix-turn-helix (wHTH) protein/tetratricopeptide (TPR) repeat protein
MSLSTRDFYKFEDFALQPSRRALLRDGVRISISPKAFEVLLYLVQHAGQVVLKDELLSAVWPDSFVEEGNLTQQIFSLRKALTDRASCIATIPGRGYEFTAQVSVLSEPLPSQASSEVAEFPAATVAADFQLHRSTEMTRVVIEETTSVAAAPRAGARARLGRWGWVAAAAALAVAGAAWAGWHWTNHVVAGDHHEIVLADFGNSTGDPEFDRALKTLLIFDLSQSSFLSVASESDARKTLKLMKQSPDSELTPGVAREVCERLNDQAVLAGEVANAGQKYLVTLIATDCVDGKVLVSTRALAQNRDGVIQAVDTAAAAMRKRLGEPLRTLRPGQKLEPVHTNSLQALKLYGDARALHLRFKFQDAAAMYQKAIEADPNFASAYSQLANCYNNLGEQSKAEDAMSRAYALRDQTDDLDRMRITTMYEYWKYGDRHQAILNYRTWTQMFPRSAAGWDLLGEFEDSVGNRTAAIEAEKKAVEVNPMGVSQYSFLAQLELSEGRFEEVKETCRQAFAHGVDLVDLHRILRDAAVFQHDAPAVREQTAWIEQNGSQDDRDDAEADLDLSEGKIQTGLALKLKEVGAAQKDGRSQAALEKLASITASEANLGLVQQARAHLRSFHPAPAVNSEAVTNIITAAAETGDLAFADSLLKHMVETNPKDSDVVEFFAPEARAVIALARHRPQEAISALTPALPYALVYRGVFELGGRAYLENHQPEQAAANFRQLTDHPSSLGLGEEIGISHLELARSLVQAGNLPAAREEYATFFKIWKDADPELPPLVEAKREFGRLAVR